MVRFVTGSNFDRNVRKWVLALTLIVATPCFSVADPYADADHPTITDIRIDIADYPDPKGEMQRLVRTLLLLKKGDQFSPGQLEDSIKTLRQTRRFDAIHVDSSEDKLGRFELHFKLTPYPLIKSIRFRHAYPAFESDLLKLMTLSIGDPLRREKLPRQTEALVQHYRKEGFIAPIVDIRPEIYPVDSNCHLHIQMDKGPYYRLGHLSFTGNHSLSNFQLKRKMKTWRRSLVWGISGRFIENELKEDIKTLNQNYQKKKYAEAQVGYKLFTEKDTQAVKVAVEIDEGPIYRVEFIGNRTFSTHKLNKDLVLFTEGNTRSRGERKSIKNIENRYRNAGFLESTVKIETESIEEDGRKIRLIRFVVHEGPRSVVRNVQIRGNKAFTTEALMKNVLTRSPGWNHDGRFSPKDLEDDIRSIQFQYTEKGFLNPVVRAEEHVLSNQEEVSIIFNIEEGIATRVGTVTFEGLTAITNKQALDAVSLKLMEPFREYMIKSDETILKALIAQKGYPHVKIQSHFSLSEDRTLARITYRIGEGPFVRLGSIFYQGNFRSKKKVIEREWTLASGDPLNPLQLFESQKNIRNLDIFSAVDFRRFGFEEKDEKVDMIITIEERKPYYFELSGGYESDRRFFMSTKLADRNLFGMNRMGWVSGEVSEIGYRFESGIRDPRWFGTHIATNLHGFFEREEQFNQNFGTKKAGTTLGFELAPTKRITTGLHVSYEYLDQFEKDVATSPPALSTAEQEKPRNVLVGTPRIQFDSRDSFIRPRKGIFSLGDIDISKGLRNDLDNFLRYRLNFRFFWTPKDLLTFAFIGRGGYLAPYSQSDNIPKDQLFYLGGNTDIRGFKQNAMVTDSNGDAVGGQKSLSGNIEARIGMGSSWELPLFIDVGWLGGILEPDIEPDVRVTVGTGLRYITPIGPIGILYGYKLDRQPGEQAGAFHFSLGYTF